MKPKFTTSALEFDSKPTKREISTKINPSITLVKEATVEEFADFVVQSKIKVFCPALYDGVRNSENWISQQIFCVDFDKGITPEKALNIARSNGVLPNIWYTTLSDTPETRRFRFVYVVDRCITDSIECKRVIDGLHYIFKEYCDLSCRDLARFFYGGKEKEVLSTIPIDYEIFKASCDAAIVSQDNGRTRNLEKNPTSYNNIITSSKNLQDQHLSPLPSYLRGSTLTKKKFDFDTACLRVRILNDFKNYKWLHHNELFGIVTSLHWVTGGLKWMKKIMNEFNAINKGRFDVNAVEIQYSENNFNALKCVSHHEYRPQNLSKYSPYEEDHEYENIITATIATKGHIEIIEPRIVISVCEAEEKMKYFFDSAIKANDNGIYILKVPTGLGKTKLLENFKESGIIACPTHKLKDEVANRMSVPITVTPETPQFNREEFNSKLKEYQNNNAIDKYYKLLNTIATSINHIEDMRLAKRFFDQNELCYSAKTPVLTTHAKIMYGSEKFKNHDLIIFDECPLNSIISIKGFNYSKLLTVLDRLNNKSNTLRHLQSIIQKLNRLDMHLPIRLSELAINLTNIDINEIIDFQEHNSINGAIIGLFESDFIISNPITNTITYSKANGLDANKKYIILSATAPVDIYKKLFGERVSSPEIQDVEHQGKIIQYTKKSCSRSSLNRNLDSIVQKVGDDKTITFTSYKSSFSNSDVNMHFGNCSGYDELRGMDLAVVGTPHFDNSRYFLTAKSANINFSNISMTNTSVSWNGFRFPFYTFEDVNLREIQLSLIEAELTQAVGRNRPLRENVTTKLYSNFPLRFTSEFINE